MPELDIECVAFEPFAFEDVVTRACGGEHDSEMRTDALLDRLRVDLRFVLSGDYLCELLEDARRRGLRYNRHLQRTTEIWEYPGLGPVRVCL